MRNVPNTRKKRAAPSSEGDGGIWLALLSSVLLGGCSTMYGPSAGVGGVAGNLSGQQDASRTLPEVPPPVAPTPPVAPIQGRAINGYLVNALVFQDTNRDGLLSLNENLALTDASGQFTLPGTSSGDLIVKPVNMLSDAEKAGAQERLRALGVVNPDIQTTYYQTGSGGRVEFKGQLEMPAAMVTGAVNVTPLTTLVNGLVHAGNLDLAAASQKVEQLFGMAPTTDYVAMASSPLASVAEGGTELKQKAVALSNFLTSALEFYEDSLSKADLLELLAVKVLAKLDEVSANPLADLDVAAYLASSEDIKSILLEIGDQKDLEINLVKLGSVVDSLVAQNRTLVDGDVVRLSQDTGISGVDHITSDWRFSLPDSSGTTSYVYAVTNRLVGAQENWLPETWYSDPEALNFSQGINTVFIKPQPGGSEGVMRLTLNYDSQSPQLLTVEGGRPIEIFQSSIFQPDGQHYAARVDVQDTFFVNQESAGTPLLPQFQLVRANASGVLPQANNTAWLQFPNISDREVVNGADMRLYYRQMDVAGNFSQTAQFDFVYDNVAPIVLLEDDVSLARDTGLYAYDRYTSSLTLQSLQERFLDAHDELTVVALGQWIQKGDAIDTRNYAVNPVRPVVDGEYTFVAQQVDRAGNISETLRIDYVLDTTAPDVKQVAGFKAENGRALPLLDYDRSADSLIEWVQYRMVDASATPSQRDATPWLNVSAVSKSGIYDVYYRSMDRAGNTSLERYAGQVNIDLDAPVLKLDQVENLSSVGASDLLDWLKARIEVEGEASIRSQTMTSQTLIAPGLLLTDHYVTAEDGSGNVSSPWSVSTLLDGVRRAEVRTVHDAGFFMQAGHGQPADFILNETADTHIALGSALSDRAVGLSVGDIYLGLGGGDLTLVDESFVMTGLSFLNQAELQFLVDTFEDFLTNEQLQQLKLSPILKAYLENPDDPEAGGIALFQSQITRYGAASSPEYLVTKWNPSLGRWFVALGSNDDALYFGGDAMNVYGGAGSDLLQGGSGDDYLIAGSNAAEGSDVLRGFAGNDTLVAGDYLFHSNVSAVLEGGGGNDTLIAGNGHSQMRGGAGSDVFLIAPIEHASAPIQAEILDFTPGSDHLMFNGLNKDAVMKGIFVDQEAGNVVIDLTNLLGPDKAPFGSRLTISGWTDQGLLPEDILADWFDFSTDGSFEWSDLAIDALISS